MYNVTVLAKIFLTVMIGSASSVLTHSYKAVPRLVVFDLDMCMWSPEMYELSVVPDGSSVIKGKLNADGHEGCIAVKSGDHDQIKLFPDALKILQKFHEGKFGDEMRIAAASSADTPRAVQIGRAAMDLLEVAPGVTMRSVFNKGWPEGFEGNMQIGRSPPLSSNKAETHFPILREATGIPYNKMIFFDDCNWGDHCANVERMCPGVVTMRTPRGMQMNEFERCMELYEKKEMTNIPSREDT